jgi:hypothetical protein
MKQNISYLSFFFVVLFVLGCTSGKKALESGNYDQSNVQRKKMINS